MNKKIAKVKSYITIHAPELVTAVATIGILAVVAKDRKDLKDGRDNMGRAISKAKDEGWTYDFYPGVGLFVDDFNRK